MKNTKRLKIIIGVILTLLLVFIACGLYNPLSVSEFTVNSDKIDVPVKIALISDLHSCQYGDKQTKITDIIDKQNPDLICLTGDLFDERHINDNAELLIAAISEKYPCYYVAGNHEFKCEARVFLKNMKMLEEYGVVRLSDESTEWEVHGQKITICGIDDIALDEYEDDDEARFFEVLNTMRQGLPKTDFSLLLSHRPQYFPKYTECGYDLILCGHAHGGQWRIPGILENGLFTRDQGLFPQYANGKFESGDSTMIVSRGLAKARTIVPRFYNRPEIVFIEIQ